MVLTQIENAFDKDMSQMKSDNTELKTDYLKMLCIKC